MKKLILLVLATVMATFSQATITPTENQLWWGYFNESDFNISDKTIGNGTPATICAAIFIPANHAQVGSSTVKAVRIYIGNGLASTISNLKVWISKSLPNTADAADYVQSVSKSLTDGANDFELSTPYEVKSKAFYIGYSFTSSNGYPVRCGGDDTPNSFLISIPGAIDWDDMNGYGFGKLAFQILLDGATISNDCASIANFGPMVASPGQSLEVPVTITNDGGNDIKNISYTVTVNGSTSVEKTITVPTITFNGSCKINAVVNTMINEGAFPYTITITKVNGKPNTSKNSSAIGVITTVTNLKTWPRNVLIEEFTTEYCGYCPDAAAGLASFMNGYPDLASRVAVVCHHAGFYTDWLTIQASNSYTWFYNSGGTYAPAFMYDRYAWDGNTPVVSRGKYKDYVDQRISETSYANINLTAYFNADKSAINVTANCERGWDFSSTPARITLFLTEDNIKAHSQSGASGTFVHQHVLRAVNETWGSVINWSGNKAKYTYTFKLDSSWKTGDLKVVAIISAYDSSDATKCVVENTAKTAISAPTVIYGDVNGDGVVDLDDSDSIVQYIMAGEYEKKADLNNDGKVNVADIVEIVKMLK